MSFWNRKTVSPDGRVIERDEVEQVWYRREKPKPEKKKKSSNDWGPKPPPRQLTIDGVEKVVDPHKVTMPNGYKFWSYWYRNPTFKD